MGALAHLASSKCSGYVSIFLKDAETLLSSCTPQFLTFSSPRGPTNAKMVTNWLSSLRAGAWALWGIHECGWSQEVLRLSFPGRSLA